MILNWLQRYRARKQVRPWALLAPIVVLLVALPLLRPLRYPDPRYISAEELSHLTSVQALVEGTPSSIASAGPEGRLSLLAVLLSAPYWFMHRWGLTFNGNPQLVTYFLTLLGVTVPVAAASGLTYRIARLFELRRAWRALLALAVVFASGLIGYATSLNSHAPAAALVLAATACIVHVTITNRRVHGSVWLITAGICAALAAAIDPPAALFLILLPLAILSLRWRPTARLGGLLAYALGALLPLALHLAVASALTGQSFQQTLKHTFNLSQLHNVVAHANDAPASTEEELSDDASWLRAIWERVTRILSLAIGGNGLLSRSPVMVIGFLGVAAVMHRHWPTTTKVLAAATVAGLVITILYHGFAVSTDSDWGRHSAVIFLPLLLFWAGAWLRRRHSRIAWALAGIALAFSVTLSMVSAASRPPHGPLGGDEPGAMAKATIVVPF